MDYWKECIEEAFEDAKIVATDEQIGTVASWAEGAHDNYSQSHGYDVIPNPLVEENERLLRELRVERDMVHCKECGGKGYIVINGPSHSAESTCHICRGKGRHS